VEGERKKKKEKRKKMKKREKVEVFVLVGETLIRVHHQLGV
jgi:hypothetical protein